MTALRFAFSFILFSTMAVTNSAFADANECQRIKEELGQLFYVNVDGNGQSAEAIDPAYIRMVHELNIGGVLPKPLFQKSGFDSIAESNRKLQAATKLPLFIGLDKVLALQASGPAVHVGLGYGAGKLSDINRFSAQCAGRWGLIEAFLHRALGLNQALGPTIERNPKGGLLAGPADEVEPYSRAYIESFNELGVLTTLKHFPYTPDDWNPHTSTADTQNSVADVYDRLEIFRRNAGQSDFVMSTHLYNSNIDPDSVATFSKKWVEILRQQVGFKGLLMTDGLIMIDNNGAAIGVLKDWPSQYPVNDNHTIFAIRAILAGHDMVILEGTSVDTRNVFREVTNIACQDGELPRRLRERIAESYERIRAFKLANATALRPQITIPRELISKALDFEYASSCAGNDSLKKDPKFTGACRAICSDDKAYEALKQELLAFGFAGLKR